MHEKQFRSQINEQLRDRVNRTSEICSVVGRTDLFEDSRAISHCK